MFLMPSKTSVLSKKHWQKFPDKIPLLTRLNTIPENSDFVKQITVSDSVIITTIGLETPTFSTVDALSKPLFMIASSKLLLMTDYLKRESMLEIFCQNLPENGHHTPSMP
jgi:hypothetical protein